MKSAGRVSVCIARGHRGYSVGLREGIVAASEPPSLQRLSMSQLEHQHLGFFPFNEKRAYWMPSCTLYYFMKSFFLPFCKWLGSLPMCICTPSVVFGFAPNCLAQEGSRSMYLDLPITAE